MTSPESRSTLAQQRASAQEELEVVITQLLIELAFLLPRGTNVHRHSVGRGLVRFKKAVEDCVKADALLTSGTPEPANMKVAVAGRMETTIATFQQRCDRLLADEQQKIAPDNALIAVLCDAVRLAREYVELATKPIGGTPEPAPATCATCRWWMKDSQGDTGECFQADTVAWNGDGSYNITKEWFGCTLWSARPAQEGDAP
jgi:hypothetical protein